MFKVCLENRIVHREKDYKCFLCHCEDIDNNYESVEEHLKQWRHKKLLKEMDQFERKKELDVIDSISETQRKILVENYIAIANRKYERYRCYMCSTYLPSLSVVFDHLQTFVHKTNYKKKFSSALTVKNKDNTLTLDTACVGKQIFFEKEYWCQICQVTLNTFALIKCHSMAHFFQKHHVKQDDVIYFNYVENTVVKITCLLCEKSVDTIELLEHHLNTSDHQSRINQLSSKANIGIEDHTTTSTSQCEFFEEYVTVMNIFCKVCSKTIPVNDFKTHTHSKEHYNKALLKISEGAFKPLKDSQHKAKLDSSNNYMCFVCNRSYATISHLLKHYNATQHKSKIAAMYMLINKGQSVQQVTTDKHQTKSKSFSMNINDKDLARLSQTLKQQVRFEEPNYSTSNKITHLKNSKKNKLTEVSTGKAPRSNLLLPRNRKLRKPKVNKKIMTQSDKNLAIFGNTYVNMCIEPGSRNIYDISGKTNRLLNLSTGLIVPTDSVWICIPCADKIPDNEFLIYEHLNDVKHTTNVKKLEVDDQLFAEYPDQFSDLKLAKAHMQDESDSYVHCYACNTKVSNSDDSIRQHLVANEHILKSRSLDTELKEMSKALLAITNSFWYYAHFFICEICTLSFNIELEFIIHLKSKAHLQNANEIKLKGVETKFHTCPTCLISWYGKSDSYINHIKSSLHKRLMDSREFIVPPISVLTYGLLNDVKKNIKHLICECDRRDTQEEQDQELSLLGYKSKLVGNFKKALPLCRELILYLKKWLDLCQLTEANSMTTYAISWFVIFFLQVKEILPSVHELIKMKNNSTLVDGWECGFEESIPAEITNLPIQDLIKQFFLYYAHFDYKSNVICPYLGTTIKKSCFANIEQLPEQMKVYQTRIIRGEVKFFQLDSPMCIQDPIEQSLNITKAVKKLQLQYFMQYCAESLEKLNC